MPPEARVATHALLVKVVHTVLDELPALQGDEGELEEAVKTRLARLGLHVTESGYGASHLIYRAIESALFQRRHIVHGTTPSWKQPWQEKQRAERDRRRRAIR